MQKLNFYDLAAGSVCHHAIEANHLKRVRLYSVKNIFIQTKIQLDGVSVEYFNL